jgi:hypothetical protein
MAIRGTLEIGFTGSRSGMGTQRQELIPVYLRRYKTAVVHHGMCEGSDTEFHDLVRNNFEGISIVGHPPTDKSAYVYRPCDHLWTDKPYLDRNRDIVNEADIMFATPFENQEKLRSGTWATIRYAKKVIKEGKGNCWGLYIFRPDGGIEYWHEGNL